MADPARVAFGQRVFDYFTAKGLPPDKAAAIAGNIAWESGGRTDGINIGDNPKYPNAPHSYGVSQWNGDRLVGLINYARSQGADIPAGSLADPNYLRSISSKLPLETQLGYVWNEMQGPEKGAYSRIAAAPDLRAATAGAIGYHRPAGYHPTTPEAGHGFGGRYDLASKILAAGPGTPPPPAPYDMYGEDVRPAPAAPAPTEPAVAAAPGFSLPAAAPPKAAAPDQNAIVEELTRRLKEDESGLAAEMRRFGSFSSPEFGDEPMQLQRGQHPRMNLSKLRAALGARAGNMRG